MFPRFCNTPGHTFVLVTATAFFNKCIFHIKNTFVDDKIDYKMWPMLMSEIVDVELMQDSNACLRENENKWLDILDTQYVVIRLPFGDRTVILLDFNYNRTRVEWPHPAGPSRIQSMLRLVPNSYVSVDLFFRIETVHCITFRLICCTLCYLKVIFVFFRNSQMEI